ncbi:MAG: CotH kinase family protein [Chitinispirillia bacterium]|nr:CotH kinase family protein [Chitinispirillia bacterium]MCL2268049.1 CotH kinase family protein [Chitinispirillia bacterium]
MKHKSLAVRLATAFVVCASTLVLAQSSSLPVMRITADREPTVSGGSFGGAQTMNYVRMTKFELTGHPTVDIVQGEIQADSIRVRGNSTAGMDKKPYRIKFAKEQSLFGKPKANSWVLLANYYDHTMALNAVAFSLGQRLGLPYTPSSQFVELYINNSYKGIYQLTEQIQVKKDRVNVDKVQGWLVEFDYHDADPDQVKQRTTQYQMFTRIRSPEVECANNVSSLDNCWTGSANNPTLASNTTVNAVKFVMDEVNALTNKMAESGFPNNGYRDMIDMDSWAKYVLIQQLIDNFDFNNKAMAQQGGGMFGGGSYGAEPGSNYAFRDFKDGAAQRIFAGPLWDFDLAAGVHPTQSFPTHYVTYNEPIRPKHAFYQRLWDDPEFLRAFKNAWDKHQADFNAIPALVDSIANFIRPRVIENFNAYGGSSGGWGFVQGEAKPTNMATFDTRVNGLKTWWNNRMRFFGEEVNKLNIPDNPIVIPSTYTLTASANPTEAGSVNPTSQANINSGSQTPITASANTGYTFQYWTLVSGNATFVDATSASTTVSLSSNAAIRANFTKDSDPPKNTSGDTIRIQAESMTPAPATCPTDIWTSTTACSAVSGNMTYVRNPNATTANYTVNISADDAGYRDVVFRIAANNPTSFTVTVNGTAVGSISVASTGGTAASNYSMIQLPLSIELKTGENTIVLAFSGSVYTDYFELIRTDTPNVSVRYSASKSARANIVLTNGARGFTAALPSNHGYTAYKLIDPRGRTIRSGKVANGTANLKFNNLPKGVVFLRLEGKNTTRTLKAVSY